MVRRLDILLQSLAWLILSAITVACSSADEPLSENGDDVSGSKGAAMMFRFNIYSDDSEIRSRELGVWEENPATVAERILNVDDMRILFFDQGGQLLKSVKPSNLEYSGSEFINNGYYTLSVAFSHDYFDRFNDDAVIPFQVMILANLGGTGSSYLEYNQGSTLVDDIKDSFVLSPGYYPDENTGIPMFGLKSFSIPKSQLMELDAPVAGEIDLLRSLCKIEVTDRTANAAMAPDGNRYPKVNSVEMISWADHGYIRPLFDNYAGGLKYANIFPADIATETVNATKIEEGKFRLYCPEAHTRDMAFRVTAQLEPGAAPKTFDISLEGFTAAIGTELVRNHIYRFDVHALNTIADLNVEVSDWIVQTDEFELDNIVSVEPDGFMKWAFDPANFAVSTETYNDKNEEQLSILNGTSTYATGTFHLISPRGAIWKAYFIPGENGVDAFEFVDVDSDGNVISGSEKVVTEGIVGERATIHIRGKGAADSYRHWAELVVEVHTADGNVLYAPLTSSMSSRYIIYRENKL